MEKPDSVDVEISSSNRSQYGSENTITNYWVTVLDPYFMNAVPESLFPIGGMIALIALLAWWGSGRIYSGLGRIGATYVIPIEAQEKKDS